MKIKKFLFLQFFLLFFIHIFSTEKYFRFLNVDFSGMVEGNEKITKSEYEKIEAYKVVYNSTRRICSVEPTFLGKNFQKDIFNTGDFIGKIEVSYFDTFFYFEEAKIKAEKMVYSFYNINGEKIDLKGDIEKMIFLKYKMNSQKNILVYFENRYKEKVLNFDKAKITNIRVKDEKFKKIMEKTFYIQDGDRLTSYPNEKGFEKIIRVEYPDSSMDSFKLWREEKFNIKKVEKLYEEPYTILKIKGWVEEKSVGILYKCIYFDELGYVNRIVFLDSLQKPMDGDSGYSMKLIKRNKNFSIASIEYFSSDNKYKSIMPPTSKYNGTPLYRYLLERYIYDDENNLLGIERIE